MTKKKLTAIGAYEQFIEEHGVEPTKEEFMGLGYGRSTYYQVRKEYFQLKIEEDEMLTTNQMAIR